MPETNKDACKQQRQIKDCPSASAIKCHRVGIKSHLSNLDSQVLQNGKSLVDGYTPKNNLITIIKENADENRGFTGKRFDTGAD